MNTIGSELGDALELLVRHIEKQIELLDLLRRKKEEYLTRAEHCDEQIAMFERSLKNNERAHGAIAGYPTAVIIDEHGREQYIAARLKKSKGEKND